MGSKGWRSDESARLPPMWTGFKSRRRRHMWVEFVVGSLPCSERFFSGYSGFPLSSKTNISKFQFDQKSGRRRTTLWMCYLQIVIILFFFNLNQLLFGSSRWRRRRRCLSSLVSPRETSLVSTRGAEREETFVFAGCLWRYEFNKMFGWADHNS